MMSKKLKLVKELKEVATKIDRALISLNFAIGEGKLEVVKRFIKNCSDINEVDDDGQTILFQATKHGHESIVQLLLDHGCDPNVVDQSQDTVLHLVAKNGHSNIAKILVQNGAKINVQDGYRRTPLHTAVKYRHVEVAKVLLESGADVNAIYVQGDAPLHIALKSKQSNLELIKLLIDHKADLKLKDRSGKSALEICKLVDQDNQVIQYVCDIIRLTKSKDFVTNSNILTLDNCVVCLAPRNEIHCFDPCGHAKVCEACCMRILYSKSVNAICPICRHKITNYKKIFL